jgi:alpha-amylase/alpha-mannosidase (GH57 family)
LSKVYFALGIHSHQPVGNFDHVIEEAYQNCYRPFAEALLGHPAIHFSLHTSGILLEWFENNHREFFNILAKLVDRGQMELVGGGFYEPIMLTIPDEDKIAQVRRLADYIEKHFGVRPRGAWVAERVWEPSLARPLSQAGVEYVILDDTHFIAAGLDPSELRGTFITEECGASLRLVPSLKSLRYTIPFSEPEETLRVLRTGQAEYGATAPLFAVGDDCEKFGVWPGTHEHVYKNKWLEKFLIAIEEAGDWLQTTTFSEYITQHPPQGRVYLPTASYEEMMHWALPTAASREFTWCQQEVDRMPSAARIRRFLRGGMWRSFLSKYSESNQIHKLMLEVSRRWHSASEKVNGGTEASRLLAEAQTHLLASQCNDAYWHGIFGGLYAPHLRSALLRNLIQAEVLLDKLEDAKENATIHVQTRDFDVDGREEILAENPTFAMVVRAADGGTISSLRFKPANLDLINSLMRRQEAYHDQVLRHVDSGTKSSHEGPASIHDRVLSKEADLSALLRYDNYARNAFRTFLFPSTKKCEDFDYLRLEEIRELAGGAWASVAKESEPGAFAFDRQLKLRLNGKDLSLNATKTIKAQGAAGTVRLDCHSTLTIDEAATAPLAVGVELVFNLLAPDVPDRYFLANEMRRPLEFKGEINATQLTMVDEWQQVSVSMRGNPEPRWWIVPIETISQSESGFERVYQGSAIMAVWKIEPADWRSMSRSLRVDIKHLSKA